MKLSLILSTAALSHCIFKFDVNTKNTAKQPENPVWLLTHTCDTRSWKLIESQLEKLFKRRNEINGPWTIIEFTLKN